MSEYTDPLLDVIDELHKTTHVRHDTIFARGGKIREMFSEILLGIDGLLAAAEDSRHAVTRAIADIMHHVVFGKLLSETIQELDVLSNHTTIEDHYIDTVEVKSVASAVPVRRDTNLDLQGPCVPSYWKAVT